MRTANLFTSACLIGAVLAHKYQTYSEDHHKRDAAKSLSSKPENNAWDEYWASNETSYAFGDFAKCLSCSAAMTGAQRLLEVKFIHNGILSLASVACDISGMVGHRFGVCP